MRVPVAVLTALMLALLSPAAHAQDTDWCRAAIQADAAGDAGQAIEAYGKCLEVPDLPPEMRGMFLHQRGLAYDSLERYDEAITDFTAALPMIDEPEKTFGARGLSYARSGNWDKAIYDFTQSLNADPEQPMMFWMRAIARLQIDDTAAALDDYNRSVVLDPNNPMVLSGRAELRASLDDMKGAIDDYGRAIQIDPRDARAYNGRAWYRYVAGIDEAAALDDVEIALALAPDESDYVDTKAHLLSSMGQVEEAYGLFIQAAELGGAERILWYQQELNAKGYDAGEENGELDDATRAAFHACVVDDCRLLADFDLPQGE